jgi:hypothetical protein
MSSGSTANAAVSTPFRPAVPPVLHQHLEEYGFLQLQRRRLLFSTDFPLRRLPGHDERIAAHWDGLVLGADASVKIALDRFDAEDPWEIASAIRVWLELGRPAATAVADRVAAADPEAAPSWREAFRQCAAEVVRAALPAASLSALPSPALAIAIEGLGWQGSLTPALAQTAVNHADPLVRAALARNLPWAGLGPEVPTLMRRLLDDAETAVARRALWSAANLEPAAALERARHLSRGPQPEPFALRVLGLLGGPEDAATLVAAADGADSRPAACWALADLGTSEAVVGLIRLLALPDRSAVPLIADALESAVGTIPREDLESPPSPAAADDHWRKLHDTLPRDTRIMDGRARPWKAEESEEPLRWLWRAAIAGQRPQWPWLRREVPDGFFDGVPVSDARPGE